MTNASMSPDDLSRDLVLVHADDPGLTHLGVVSDTYTILVTGADTDGRYSMIDMLIPPGGGPPPHRHDFEEMFHVLSGEIEVTFRDRTVVAAAGATVNIPARAPHHFHNSSTGPARVLCMVTPPGLDEYFAAFGDPLPSRTSPAPQLSEDELQKRLLAAAPLAAQHHIENLPPD